jgi:predicted transglutaminase-like cysteine proteinase
MANSLSVIALVTAGVLASSSGEAAGIYPVGLDRAPSIQATTPTLAPFQHIRFCIRYPSVELTPDLFDLMDTVNDEVNSAISPAAKRYGSNLGDGWNIAPISGDCNDYAVTKRHALLQRGVPSRSLRLSVVKTASGIGHLVLVVSTTKGPLVLDNLANSIRPWHVTGYQWLKIQSADNANYWYDIAPSVGHSPPARARVAEVSQR